MIEINVTVKCPDLILATTALAKLLRPSEVANPTPAQAAPALAASTPTTAAPTPAPKPVQMTAVPTASVVPAPAPAAAPISAAPTYTIDQITKAGADLVQAGKMPQLYGLMQQFQISAATDLRPEQYGAFATALREMGAQI